MATAKKAAVKKAPAKSTEVAVIEKQPSTALVDWKSILGQAQQQNTEVAAEVATGAAPRLKFDKAGIEFNGTKLPTNTIDVAIVGMQFYREFYDQPYDANNPTGPKCYSFDGNAPHAKAHAPQAKACKDCPFDKFDSNPNGRGSKGCSEIARIAVVHADDIKKPAKLNAVEPAVARISVMNRKQLAKYVASGVPLATTISTIVCDPPAGKGSTGYDLHFEAKQPINVTDAIGASLASLVQGANKKFQEPLPEYKEREVAKTRRKFSAAK